MASVSPILPVTHVLTKTLIKRQKLEEWIKKYDLVKYCLQETCLRFKDTSQIMYANNIVG